MFLFSPEQLEEIQTLGESDASWKTTLKYKDTVFLTRRILKKNSETIHEVFIYKETGQFFSQVIQNRNTKNYGIRFLEDENKVTLYYAFR